MYRVIHPKAGMGVINKHLIKFKSLRDLIMFFSYLKQLTRGDLGHAEQDYMGNPSLSQML